MATTLNRPAYERMVQENIEWLLKQPRTLEREHIEMILRDSVRVYYDLPCSYYARRDRVQPTGKMPPHDHEPPPVPDAQERGNQ